MEVVTQLVNKFKGFLAPQFGFSEHTTFGGLTHDYKPYVSLMDVTFICNM